MFCTKCGTKFEENAVVCANCKSDRKNPPTKETPQNENIGLLKKTRIPKLKIPKMKIPIPYLAGLVVVLAAFGVGMVLLMQNKNRVSSPAVPEPGSAVFSEEQSSNPNLSPSVAKPTMGYIEVVPPMYDWISPFSEGLAAVSLDGRAGFIDKTGNVVIPLVYSVSESFSEGLAAVRISDLQAGEKWGFIDKDGNEVVSPKYSDARAFSEGLAAVKIGGWQSGEKWGFIDESGNEVISFIYDMVGDFSQERAIVHKDSSPYEKGWGIIDKTGKEIAPFKYDMYTFPVYIPYFTEGFVAMELDDMNVFLDRNGNEHVFPGYSHGFFREGMTSFSVGDKYGFIDTAGREVVPAIYDYVTYFSEGLAAVFVGELWGSGRWGFIDKTGNEVIPLMFENNNVNSNHFSIGKFSEGLAAVIIDGRWGYIDKTGNEVIGARYDYACDFSEGMAAVLVDNKWGFIDKDGDEIVPNKYNRYFGHDEVYPNFQEGMAVVYTEDNPDVPTIHGASQGKWGVITLTEKDTSNATDSTTAAFSNPKDAKYDFSIENASNDAADVLLEYYTSYLLAINLQDPGMLKHVTSEQKEGLTERLFGVNSGLIFTFDKIIIDFDTLNIFEDGGGNRLNLVAAFDYSYHSRSGGTETYERNYQRIYMIYDQQLNGWLVSDRDRLSDDTKLSANTRIMQ